MKLFAYVTVLLLLSACTSLPIAPSPLECPKYPEAPAWVMTPAQNLTPLLDKIISISEPDLPDSTSN